MLEFFKTLDIWLQEANLVLKEPDAIIFLYKN